MSLEDVGNRMRANRDMLLDYVSGMLQLTAEEKEELDIRISIRRSSEYGIERLRTLESVYVVKEWCETKGGVRTCCRLYSDGTQFCD